MGNNLALPPFDKGEILRYAGARGEVGEEVEALLAECLKECENKLSPRVTHLIVARAELLEKIPLARESKGLANALCDSEEVVLFAATLGIEMDRLLHRYGAISPAKALLFQAIGAERIEAVCDGFCAELTRLGYYPRRRFSPGYGDFPLEAQRELLTLLNASKKIGVSLTDSLLMLPTKSVTALAGLSKTPVDGKGSCATCGRADCVYRK